jgi:HK97 family phage prohead protease
MKRKTLGAKFHSTAGGFTATITTAAIDRDNEVVIPQGMNAAEYETNPVLFWNHDYNLPVGKCVKLTRETNGIVGEFEFAKRPDGFEGQFFPDFVSALVGQGIVRGVSIGYSAEEGGTRRATVDDRKRYGGNVDTVYSKWKLMEVSVAPMQANPAALISAVRKGLLSGSDVARWLDYRAPTRHTVVVPMPSTPWAGARVKANLPMDVPTIVAREIARARGALR